MLVYTVLNCMVRMEDLLVIANSKKGDEIVKKAPNEMYGYELKFEDALKYQGPL